MRYGVTDLLRDGINGLMSVVWPDRCAVCGRRLTRDEKLLCLACEVDIPRTNIHFDDFSEIHKRLGHKVRIERAASYFYYIPGGGYAALIHEAKYHNRPATGRKLARGFAEELKSTGFFDGIDGIAAVPLHYSKLLGRGYNQSRYIASGLGDMTGIKVIDILKCSRAHSSQTRKSALERWRNVKDIYKARSCGDCKHILVVDDVITTGSTLSACCEAIAAVNPGVKISVLTLGLAGVS